MGSCFKNCLRWQRVQNTTNKNNINISAYKNVIK